MMTKKKEIDNNLERLKGQGSVIRTLDINRVLGFLEYIRVFLKDTRVYGNQSSGISVSIQER